VYGIIELRILEQAKAFAEKAKLRIDAVGLSNCAKLLPVTFSPCYPAPEMHIFSQGCF
jgi:hypothetical protein